MVGYWTIIKTNRNGFDVFCPRCESGSIYNEDSSSHPDLKLMYSGSKCRDCGYKDLSENFPTLRELRINQILE